MRSSAFLRRSCGLLAAVLAGCAGASHPKSTSYMIRPAQAEFYKSGPAQAVGPDRALPRGERVTLLQAQIGYSRVSLADGTTGYISTEYLTPAPPPVAVRATVALTGRNAPPVRAENPVGVIENPLDFSDTPLPKDGPVRFRETQPAPRASQLSAPR